MNKIKIIPRYDHILDTVMELNDVECSFEQKHIKEYEHVYALNAEVEKLDDLARLGEYIDLIVVRDLTESVLDDYYHSLSSDKFDIDEKFVFYSPTAEKHPGKMSKNSNAIYSWIIYRREEPIEGDNPVAMLLQEIIPNGETSEHHHEETLEYFLALAGKTIIGLEKEEKIEELELEKYEFLKVEPHTFHQLRSGNGTALNCLCMKPYDPELNDHFHRSK
jgi:mannose-6-phosphate isomerase-like protein (cupin superfamily)